jgi:hypothetical protein
LRFPGVAHDADLVGGKRVRIPRPHAITVAIAIQQSKCLKIDVIISDGGWAGRDQQAEKAPDARVPLPQAALGIVVGVGVDVVVEDVA